MAVSVDLDVMPDADAGHAPLAQLVRPGRRRQDGGGRLLTPGKPTPKETHRSGAQNYASSRQ